MYKTYFSFILALSLYSGLFAQSFSAASQGVFDSTQVVKIMLTDSTEADYTYDGSYEIEDNLKVLPVIDEDGEKQEIATEDILYVEIYRGEEGPYEVYEDEDENEDAKLSYIVEKTDKLIFERVEVTKKYGTPYSGKYSEDSYLLQLVSGGLGDYLKVYLAPNFEEGGTELTPKGSLIKVLDRNRVDYTAVEEYYFIKVGEAPAFRLHADDYVGFAPLIYENSRGFRKKYSVPRDLPEERTKKRKKTTRKNVGKGKKKTSPLRIDEFPQHLIEYHEFYVVEEAERQEKIKAREAARAARNSKGN